MQLFILNNFLKYVGTVQYIWYCTYLYYILG